MSADELAKKIGKDRSTIYRYENGDIGNFPLDLLIPIADALEISPKQLLAPSKDWKIDLDRKNTLPVVATSNEWLSDRAARWFDATDRFEFSDNEIILFYEIAKYIIGIQNANDYDERMDFLFLLFRQLNK